MIRNTLLKLSLVMAMVIFVLSSVQVMKATPVSTLSLVLSGGYILLFCWVNEVGVND